MNHLLTLRQLVKKDFKLVSLTKPAQARTSLLMYIMIVCKINNDDKDAISNIDQNNNHLVPVDNFDLHKLVHQY